MKKLFSIVFVLALSLSLCACSMGGTSHEPAPETTVAPTTEKPSEKPSEMPTEDSILPKPNVPDTTESRGSTDDSEDSKNETLPEEVDRMRRRLIK